MIDKKILVIEDDPVATRLIDYVLRQRGYQVLTAPNGLAGLQLAQQEQPDLIILNIMLPGIDGFEVCHRLRAGSKTYRPFILMLSGRAQAADISNGLATGADDYLTKPASPSEIISRVDALLARQAGTGLQVVCFSGSVGGVGTTTAAVNTSIAMAQLGKKVLLVDLCPYERSAAAQLGIRPVGVVGKQPGRSTGTSPSSPMVHQAGINVLRSALPAGNDEKSCGSLAWVFEKYGKETDYFVFDLPLRPGGVTSEVLGRCTQAVIVSDHGPEALLGARSAVNIMRFLGVPPEKIGLLITDMRGSLAAGELAGIRPYIELHIAASVLGILPAESGMVPPAASGAKPVIIASPECPLSAAIKELAAHIAAEKAEPDNSRTGVR